MKKLFILIIMITLLGCNEKESEKGDEKITTDFTIKLGEKDGRTIKKYNGLNAGPLAAIDTKDPKTLTNVDLVNEYKQLEIEYVRTHDFYGAFDMSVVYKDRSLDPNNVNSFNLTDSDKNFKGILDAGCEPYFRLGDSYDNVNPPKPSEFENWSNAGVNFVAHFRDGKWNGFNSKFKYVEIWNEPDFDHFWPKDRSIKEFYALYKITATKLKNKFPDIKVGGPAFTQRVLVVDSSEYILKDFLKFVKTNNVPLDFISFHQYSNLPSEYVSAVARLKKNLSEEGFPNTEIIMSEWNTSVEKDAPMSEQYALRVGSRGAAANAARWIEIQNSEIAMCTFYRGNDTSNDFEVFYGIYKANGKPKKIGYAFQFFRDLSKYSQRIKLDISKSGLDVWAIAGENSSFGKGVLVANTSSKNYSYAVDSSSKIKKVYEISDAYSDKIYEFTSSNSKISLPAYSVQFITLE